MSARGDVAANKHNKSQDSGQLQKPKPGNRNWEDKKCKALTLMQ